MTRSTHDIVYLLRNNIANPCELIYSLRSLDNFEHGQVCFAGGIPDRLKPDIAIPIQQRGATKWERTTYTLREVCKHNEVSDSFWLFNDDFFILKPLKDIPYMFNGTLEEKIEKSVNSRYTRNLKTTMQELKRRGLDTKNYALHVPMLINKQKALEVIDAFEGFPMFRSLYGNYCNVGGLQAADVKILNNNDKPTDDMLFVSTNDTNFKYGNVGQYLRQAFRNKSKYE